MMYQMYRAPAGIGSCGAEVYCVNIEPRRTEWTEAGATYTTGAMYGTIQD